MVEDREDEEGESADWKQMASTGIVLAAVVAILVAGAALRAEKSAPLPATPPPAVASRAFPTLPVPEPFPQEPVRDVPEVVPPAAAPASADDLGRRATRDRKRLSRGRGSYTAQVLVSCKPENTRRILLKAASERLYLLPLPERGETCFRVCWGIYPSAKAAGEAKDLPAFLQKQGERPAPKPVSELAP